MTWNDIKKVRMQVINTKGIKRESLKNRTPDVGKDELEVAYLLLVTVVYFL